MVADQKEELIQFLTETVFNPILNSRTASEALKNGVGSTITRLNKCDAAGIVQFYWSSIMGTSEKHGNRHVKAGSGSL